MKLSKVKYLFIFLCLFCMMENTGISVISLCSHIKFMVAESPGEKKANESSEAKQVEIKEYWATHPEHAFIITPVVAKAVRHLHISSRHYHWYPPVPTPPPNLSV